MFRALCQDKLKDQQNKVETPLPALALSTSIYTPLTRLVAPALVVTVRSLVCLSHSTGRSIATLFRSEKQLMLHFVYIRSCCQDRFGTNVRRESTEKRTRLRAALGRALGNNHPVSKLSKWRHVHSLSSQRKPRLSVCQDRLGPSLPETGQVQPQNCRRPVRRSNLNFNYCCIGGRTSRCSRRRRLTVGARP
eukprot:COSAG06_NODE_5069_length_3749_cov_9.249315_3_plen_192_part_00